MANFPSHSPNSGPGDVYRAYPEVYRPWSQMSQELMNGASQIGRGERELILSYAAGLMGCDYVCEAHSHVAYAWGVKEGLIEDLLSNPETTAVPNGLRTLLVLVKQLSGCQPSVSKADVEAALNSGWSEEAVHDAIAIVARAAFMHRLVAGFGFVPRDRANPGEHARRRIEKGYFDLFDFPASR